MFIAAFNYEMGISYLTIQDVGQTNASGLNSMCMYMTIDHYQTRLDPNFAIQLKSDPF